MASTQNQERNDSQESILSEMQREQGEKAAQAAQRELVGLIDKDRNVGDLISMDYDTAEVLIHDRLRQDVGGVPHGCLLLATRIAPDDAALDLDATQSSMILLRALRSSQLPNDIEMKRARLEAGQRVAQTGNNWDSPGQTDQFTLDQMRYAGAHCRILGTFRMVQSHDGEKKWRLAFGGDIDNFYAGQGMKVYKPAGDALERIVNYSSVAAAREKTVRIGQIRYAAAIHDFAVAEAVPVKMSAGDVVAQRTALFGMTRTGKSNTTKTIVNAVFRMRKESGLHVGQLIFDPNGEYANENPQDQGCIKNVKNIGSAFGGDVVTYGLNRHPNDLGRRITKFNFFGDSYTSALTKRELESALLCLIQGKQIINDLLAEENAGYVKDFINASIEVPESIDDDRGEKIRYFRSLFVYKSILVAAGFVPQGESYIKGLFSEKIRDAMREDDDMKQYADSLGEERISSSQAAAFCRGFSNWVNEKSFRNFDNNYAKDRKWSDNRLLGLLRIFNNTRGLAIMKKALQWHDTSANTDYVEDIVNHVRAGKLVIVDQALGNPDMNKQAAERIMRRIFAEQQRAFVDPEEIDGELQKPPPVVIYIEEAHTLLPQGNDTDIQNIWARIAKEGAKFNIGLVYSTQEPSAIQTNILKNTENWFIAHLNNTDETRELKKYNDFSDFIDSIIKVNETGFLRVRTMSNHYTLPVQIDKFTAPSENQDAV